MKKEQKGITLIALVITIIVLLILAGISISLVVGENGVLTQATRSVEENEKAEEGEKVRLAAAASIDTKDLKVKKSLLENELDNSFGSGKYDLSEEDYYYLVTIKSSGRKYKIDSYGKATAISSDVTEEGDGNEDYTDSTEGPTSITILKEDNTPLNGYWHAGDISQDAFYSASDISTEFGEIILKACDENGKQLGKDDVEWTTTYASDATVETGENGEGIVWLKSYAAIIRVTSKINPDIYTELEIFVGFIEEPELYTEGPSSISIGSASGWTEVDVAVGEQTFFYVYDENGNSLYSSPGTLEYDSSNSSIAIGGHASVGMGLIQGISEGTATITVYSSYNPAVYDTVTVNVVEP